MSEALGTFYDRLTCLAGGHNFDDEGSAREIEAFAAGVSEVLAMLGIELCAKGYDPLRIDEEEKIARSYAFDLWDGGRHHPYESLGQIIEGIRKDAVKELRQAGLPVEPRVVEYLTGAK